MNLRAVSAMSQRVEDGLGIATPAAAVLLRLPTRRLADPRGDH